MDEERLQEQKEQFKQLYPKVIEAGTTSFFGYWEESL